MQSPKLATPKETAPSNRTARASAPDSTTYNTYLHKLGPARAALRRRRPPRRRPPRATARGLEPRAELLNGTPALLLFHTAERLARCAHEPGTCRDLRRSRCEGVDAGRRSGRWRRLFYLWRRSGRRLGFGAFHQLQFLGRVQSSFIARFELQLPYFTVT